VQPRLWVAIPAAGVGSRMGGPVPKQYLTLLDKTVIEHTLARFCNQPAISGVVVALGAEDGYWPTLALPWPSVKLWTTVGGSERCHSVLRALEALSERAAREDWVLVHDAARPCLRETDLSLLIDKLASDPVGGFLALPVRDTLKRADDRGVVIATVDRTNLWQALTPQMFRLGALTKALRAAIEEGQIVTDEAQAMELAGYQPRLVEGHGDNIKITRPQDLHLAALYLQTRGSALCA
jgi:2-C-methyl-D-erythritol 4-phosphate cytidylyltransferase